MVQALNGEFTIAMVLALCYIIHSECTINFWEVKTMNEKKRNYFAIQVIGYGSRRRYCIQYVIPGRGTNPTKRKPNTSRIPSVLPRSGCGRWTAGMPMACIVCSTAESIWNSAMRTVWSSCKSKIRSLCQSWIKSVKSRESTWSFSVRGISARQSAIHATSAIRKLRGSGSLLWKPRINTANLRGRFLPLRWKFVMKKGSILSIAVRMWLQLERIANPFGKCIVKQSEFRIESENEIAE